jgi:hypothetical protein
LVEKIRRNWIIDKTYIAPPKTGGLVHIDPALILTPPEGMEVGYVPILVRQEKKAEADETSKMHRLADL